MDLLENKLVRFGLLLVVAVFIMNIICEKSVENLEEPEVVEEVEEVEEEEEEEVADEVDPSSLEELAKTESDFASAPVEVVDKDLTADELLPKDAESDDFAKRHPEGAGPLVDKNFLTAGYHLGINTVGTSLRNANIGFRSEPVNPSVTPSPWNQTTITADINRRGFEIGCE